jgi:hypothetical protein
MLELISHLVRPNGLNGPCSRALIGGAQPYMVDGPPSHSAIKEGGGRGSQYEVNRAASHPTDILNPNPIQRGALQATGSLTDAGNATPTSLHRLRLHRPSLPARRWHRQRTRQPTPLLRLRLSMVCSFLLLSLSLFLSTPVEGD